MLKCSFERCPLIPEFSCSCLTPSVPICPSHTNDHILQDLSLSHRMTSCITQVTSNEKPKIISLLNSQLSLSRSLKLNLLEKGKIFQNSLTSLVSFLTQYEKILKINLRDVTTKNKLLMIFSFGNYAEGNLENQESFQFPKKLLNDINQLDELLMNFERKTSKIMKKLECESDEILHELFFTTSSSDSLKFFNKNSKRVEDIRINGVSFKRTEAAVCDSGDGKVFVYGGFYNNSYLSSAYLIDLNQNNAERLSDGLSRRQMSAEYTDKKFYVFGGYSGQKHSESAYFDLQTKRWVDISKLSSNANNTSTLLINSNILIAGKSINLSFYFPSQNRYQKINSVITVIPQNILFKFKNQIILITDSKAYKSNLNFGNTVVFNTEKTFGTVSHKPVVLEEKEVAYFADYYGKVYIVNCKTFEIKEV